MGIRLGNLSEVKHNDNYEDSKDKILEMMVKLTDAGFIQEPNCEKNTRRTDGRDSYHIYELPHVIEFSSKEAAGRAVKIMSDYSEYIEPLQVIA